MATDIVVQWLGLWIIDREVANLTLGLMAYPVVGCHCFLPDLPSHRTSLPFGQYHLLLLGDRDVCMNA